VFATSTKADASPVVGLDGLRDAYATARARGIPLVAIGGITIFERAPDVASICDAAAVIGGLVSTDMREVTEKARALHEALSRSDVGAVRVTKPARDPFDGFACRLGDVIVRAGGEEAWLAGALVLAEDAAVAAIFIAPEARRDRVVYARVRDAALVWLTPVSEEVIITGTEPPSVIEIDTARFERQRRLPLRVERVGSGTPGRRRARHPGRVHGVRRRAADLARRSRPSRVARIGARSKGCTIFTRAARRTSAPAWKIDP